MYKEPSELFEAKNMLEQLQNAVEKHQGKTTITHNDIRLISFLIRQFERYDRTASQTNWLSYSSIRTMLEKGK